MAARIVRGHGRAPAEAPPTLGPAAGRAPPAPAAAAHCAAARVALAALLVRGLLRRLPGLRDSSLVRRARRRGHRRDRPRGGRGSPRALRAAARRHDHAARRPDRLERSLVELPQVAGIRVATASAATACASRSIDVPGRRRRARRRRVPVAGDGTLLRGVPAAAGLPPSRCAARPRRPHPAIRAGASRRGVLTPRRPRCARASKRPRRRARPHGQPAHGPRPSTSAARAAPRQVGRGRRGARRRRRRRALRRRARAGAAGRRRPPRAGGARTARSRRPDRRRARVPDEPRLRQLPHNTSPQVRSSLRPRQTRRRPLRHGRDFGDLQRLLRDVRAVDNSPNRMRTVPTGRLWSAPEALDPNFRLGRNHEQR